MKNSEGKYKLRDKLMVTFDGKSWGAAILRPGNTVKIENGDLYALGEDKEWYCTINMVDEFLMGKLEKISDNA